MTAADKVFKALADPTRRRLLDRLHADAGQTLGELCVRLRMTRQAVSQHLEILEAANLVTTIRRGREKLHYLNPVPLHEIYERWIRKFERGACARCTTCVFGSKENAMDKFVYVTYIRAQPEQCGARSPTPSSHGSTGSTTTSSDWKPGSRWEHRRTDGSGAVDVAGEVIESNHRGGLS